MGITGRALLTFAWLGVSSALVEAHPVPFSYIDLRWRAVGIELTIVAHTFDLANDLKIQPPERLLEHETIDSQGSAIARLLGERLTVAADGVEQLNPTWSAPEAMPDRQSVRIRVNYAVARPPGRIDIVTQLFSYDPQHKTFVNAYEKRSRRCTGHPGQGSQNIRVLRGLETGHGNVEFPATVDVVVQENTATNMRAMKPVTG